MAPAALPDAVPDYIAVLTQAAQAFRGEGHRPAASAMVEALLQAEKVAKQQRLIYPFEAFLGDWQLCFSTGTRKVQRGGIVLGRGFYMPKFSPAQIGFSTADSPTHLGEITNQIAFAGLRVLLRGRCRYVGKRNLLAFDFHQMQILGFDRLLYQGKFGKHSPEEFEQQPVAKLPFFAFFLATDVLVAARGRGGGVAMWVRI
ncbi:hypothetical protein IFO70_09980 [Phormidium tenue FACHB-886]|nr:hypothetical protein [Phormidium tenue FACHB-886]